MELIQAIALLCQVSAGYAGIESIVKIQTKCQQSYINCVRTKTGHYDESAKLERCILEK